MTDALLNAVKLIQKDPQLKRELQALKTASDFNRVLPMSDEARAEATDAIHRLVISAIERAEQREVLRKLRELHQPINLNTSIICQECREDYPCSELIAMDNLGST